MSAPRVLRATTTTIVSYPRVDAGDFVLGVPSTPEIRIGTAAVALPDESAAWGTGTVDATSGAVTVAAVVGDTSLTVGDGFYAAFDVNAVRAAISLVLQGLGGAVFNCDSAASFMVAGGQTIATFTQVLIDDQNSLNAIIGGPAPALLPASSSALIAEYTTQVNTAANSWVKGRKYLVRHLDNTSIVVSAQTVTGNILYLAEPLERAVATSAVVSGFAITKALTTAQTDLVGNAVAILRAVVGGITYSWAHAFRIVRRLVVIPLTGDDLTAAYPVVHSMLPETQSLEEVINAAWQMRLLPKLAAKNVLEEDIVDAEVLRPLLALACLAHLVAQSRTADATWRDSINADFDRLVETTMSRRDWHDEPQDVDPPLAPDPIRRRMGLRVSR